MSIKQTIVNALIGSVALYIVWLLATFIFSPQFVYNVAQFLISFYAVLMVARLGKSIRVQLRAVITNPFLGFRMSKFQISPALLKKFAKTKDEPIDKEA